MTRFPSKVIFVMCEGGEPCAEHVIQDGGYRGISLKEYARDNQEYAREYHRNMRGNKGNMHRNMTGNMPVIMCINVGAIKSEVHCDACES